MSTLQDTVVVVTGASSGIGEATARELVDAGARVMLAARREERLAAICRELGERAAYRVTDVADRGQVEALAAATLERFGRIDALVNNAGLMPLSFLAKGKVDEWERMVDVNVKGVLWGIHAVLGHMLERGSGHVVNVASVAGHHVWPASAVYSGTKFAVRAISEGLRMETKGKVRVTLVSPGAVATELTDHITDESVKRSFAAADLEPLPAAAIGRAVRWALEQPPEVAVNEIVVRPASQEA